MYQYFQAKQRTPWCPTELKGIWTAKKMETDLQVFTRNRKNAPAENKHRSVCFTKEQYTLSLH